jgi:heme/copper-type cytochrome/quinol oxidase subunit 3
MTDVSLFNPIGDNAPAAEAARPRLLLVGTALAGAGTLMGFLGLIGLYVGYRQEVIAGGETWLPTGVTIPLTQPNMMLATWSLSVVAVVWAVVSMKNDDRANTYIAIGLATILGFAYIAQTGYLLTLMDMPLYPSGEEALDVLARPPLFYAIIGTHVVMSLVAMGYLVTTGIRALGGQYNARDLEGLYGSAMFWFVTYAAYLVMWYVIYITK